MSRLTLPQLADLILSRLNAKEAAASSAATAGGGEGGGREGEGGRQGAHTSTCEGRQQLHTGLSWGPFQEPPPPPMLPPNWRLVPSQSRPGHYSYLHVPSGFKQAVAPITEEPDAKLFAKAVKVGAAKPYKPSKQNAAPSTTATASSSRTRHQKQWQQQSRRAHPPPVRLPHPLPPPRRQTPLPVRLRACSPIEASSASSAIGNASTTAAAPKAAPMVSSAEAMAQGLEAAQGGGSVQYGDAYE